MQIDKISITNFRGIKELEIPLANLNILVGPNGLGKTTVLDAINIFFSNMMIDDIDFYQDTDEDVIFSITFDKIPEEFNVQTISGKLILLKFKKEENKITSAYWGYFPHKEDFLDYMGMSASELEIHYTNLCIVYPELPSVTTKDERRNALQQWELANLTKCTPKLQEIKPDFSTCIDLLSITDLEDSKESTVNGKRSVLNKLVDMVIMGDTELSETIAEIRKNVQGSYDVMNSEDNVKKLKKLSENMTRVIKTVDTNLEIDFNWKIPNPIDMPKPSTEVKINENAYSTFIEKSGQGTQRLFIYTVLSYYHQHVKNNTAGIKHILLIDEPEQHQYPIRKEAFFKVLEGLSNDFQIICSTHSAKFVSIKRIENIKFFRKIDGDIKVYSVSFEDIFNETRSRGIEHRSVELTKIKLTTIETHELKESLFSRLVVLVEGQTDKIYLESVAKHHNIDFSIQGISIVSCEGKENIGVQIVLFDLLKIPVYVIWDLDKSTGSSGDSTPKNTEIYKFLKEDFREYETKVNDKFSHFEEKIEVYIQQTIGSKIEEYKVEIVNDSGEPYMEKKAHCASMLVDKIYDDNRKLGTLEDIINKIVSQ